MKTTPEMIAQMEAPITKYERSDSTEKRCVAAAFRLLIADLEDAQHMLTESEADNARLRAEWSTPSEIAELRKQLAEATAVRGNGVLVPAQMLEEMQAEIRALRQQKDADYSEMARDLDELADVRKQLEEAQSSEAHWRDNHDNVVRKLRLFTQRDDLPVDRLPAYEYVLELEKKLAEAQARLKEMGQWIIDCRDRVLFPIALGQLDVGAHAESLGQAIPTLLVNTTALDAAITEAIADEKQNPWKRAIIHCLIINHILNARHETDPVRALADLIDWECKVALDPAVSEEARVLIEPYRKDAERYRWLTNDHDSPDTRVACHDISARISVMSYSAASQSIDAAIAAKGGKI